MKHALENTTNPVVNPVMIGMPQLKLAHRNVQVLINTPAPAQIKPEEVVQLVAENILLANVKVLTRGAIVVVLVPLIINILVLEQTKLAAKVRHVAKNILLVIVQVVIFGAVNLVPLIMPA